MINFIEGIENDQSKEGQTLLIQAEKQLINHDGNEK